MTLAPFIKQEVPNKKFACVARLTMQRGATRAALNGATNPQLEAIYGWELGGKMARLYTASADRVRLANAAMGKIGHAGVEPIAGRFDRIIPRLRDSSLPP
jgi:hypothetical protein